METPKKVGKKVSQNQKEILVSFLEENLDLARGRFEGINGIKIMKEKWDEISVVLNAAGGASKTGERWKKTWSDMRLYTKNRAAEGKIIKNRTGVNGFDRFKELSELEERIISIITWNAVVGEENGGQESIIKMNMPRVEVRQGTPLVGTSSSSARRYRYTEDSLDEENNNITTPPSAQAGLIFSNHVSMDDGFGGHQENRVENVENTTSALSATLGLTRRKKHRSMEDILEESLIEDRRRNALLEKQISLLQIQLEQDREKIQLKKDKLECYKKLMIK